MLVLKRIMYKISTTIVGKRCEVVVSSETKKKQKYVKHVDKNVIVDLSFHCDNKTLNGRLVRLLSFYTGKI